MKWFEFKEGEKLPKERKVVLLLCEHKEEEGTVIIAGYLRYAAGDKKCPYFVTPGLFHDRNIKYWCDCLEGEFYNNLPK